MSDIRQKREEEIINAAMKVFLEKGYIHATMEDIIDETELSKGGVYHYFNNKADICVKLMDSVTSDRLDLTDKLNMDNPDIIEELCYYFIKLLKTDSEEVKLASIILIDTRNDIELQKKIHEQFVGRDLSIISEYIYSRTNIKNKKSFERKLYFFLEIFHALLYYKYIERINYYQIESELKEMFMNIFNEVQT
ncbi:MAG: TetR/AcrR family transcriptional regulator [Methanobrevibacter olleyae]|uniref:TetR/AcrR family transcriptional regulator n=1 Tax=Methanobrevibacter olleyae TaxID=294671 RepID=A0A8T3VYG6_METOL|nr:TetR/AcrR family transcriptional regulator [Methanobrevibacter olleyae]